MEILKQNIDQKHNIYTLQCVRDMQRHEHTLWVSQQILYLDLLLTLETYISYGGA